MKWSYSKRIIWGAVGLIVLVGGVMYLQGRKPKVQYETAFVDRGEVVEVVESTASIAPSAKIKLQSEVSGKVRSVAVEEGDEVKEGDLLVEIDAKDIEAQILAQRAAVATAAARLSELQAGPTSQQETLARSAVDTAASRLAAARSAYDDATTSLANAERKLTNAEDKAAVLIDSKLTSFISDLDDAAIKAEDAVYRLTSDLFTSQDLLSFSTNSTQAKSNAEATRLAAKDAVKTLKAAAAAAKADGTTTAVHVQFGIAMPALASAKGHLEADVDVLNYALGISDTTLSAWKLNANSALSSVASAITRLQSDEADLALQEKLNEAEVTSAEIAVAETRASLNAARKNVETNEKALAEAEASLQLTLSGARPETVAAQRAVVSAEQARLTGLQNELSKRRITAPTDGEVTLIDVEIGESVQPGATIVVMNAKGVLEIIANISEIDIAKIKIGDLVDITLDAFPSDERWTGKVIAIQPAETVVDNVIFYETRVRFDGEDERLRSGMTANLEIQTARKDGVLRVPVRALHDDGERTHVEVLVSQGIVTEKDVTIGLETDDYAEVISGLKEGEEVVTSVTTK